ncbi:MAG: phosphatase PAP2 family protein [Hyphomicrobiaceae bacterium]
MTTKNDGDLRRFTQRLFWLSFAAAACALLVYLGGIVLTGSAITFDAALMRVFRKPVDLMPYGGPRFDRFVRDVTALGSFGVAALVVGVLCAYMIGSGRYVLARTLATLTIGGWLLSNVIKISVARARPQVVPMLDSVSDASMPSGHTMMATVLYFAIAGMIVANTSDPRLHRYAFACALGLALAVGLSRLYLGVHWPTDVLAAMALGTAWTAAGLRLLMK